MTELYQKILGLVPSLEVPEEQDAIKILLKAPLVKWGEVLVMSAPDNNVVIKPEGDEYLVSGHPAVATADGRTVDEKTMLELIGWDGEYPVMENNAAAPLYAERRAALRSGWIGS